MNAAGSAGDPWGTSLPGAYGAGTAGKIMGDNLNATVSSRLAGASYTAPDNTTISAIAGYVDTEVAAIKAKTDNLPASPASETTVAAVKAKTDSLTFTTTGKVDAKLTSRRAGQHQRRPPRRRWPPRSLGRSWPIWERLFGKVVKDDGAGTITLMQGSGSTAQATQTFTSTGGVDTVNRAT
jgi:hypothetical protein